MFDVLQNPTLDVDGVRDASFAWIRKDIQSGDSLLTPRYISSAMDAHAHRPKND